MNLSRRTTHAGLPGFTLIELLVVITIIALLSSIVLSALNTARIRGQDAKREGDLSSMKDALELYYSANGSYPSSTNVYGTSTACMSTWSTTGTTDWGCGSPSAFANLVSGKFIGHLPSDPVNKGGGTTNLLAGNAPTDEGYLYITDGKSYILGTNLASYSLPASPCGNWRITNNNAYACPIAPPGNGSGGGGVIGGGGPNFVNPLAGITTFTMGNGFYFPVILNASYSDISKCTINGGTYDPTVAPWAFKYADNMLPAGLVRFEIRPGDVSCSDVIAGGGQLVKSRSELGNRFNSYTFNKTYWASYDFMRECGAQITSSQRIVTGQFHGSENSTGNDSPSPIFATEIGKYGSVSDSLIVLMQTNPDPYATSGTQVHLYNTPAPISCNVWHHIVFQINFDSRPTGGTGLINYWLDGTRVVNYTGPVGNNDLAGPYWRMGAYGFAAALTGPFAVEYANLELGTADLSSRITSPLPDPY